MLDLKGEMLGEPFSRLTIQPIDCTHKGGVLGKFKPTRQAHLQKESTLLQAGWQGPLGDVELQSIACPVEGLGLVCDPDTGLCNDIHSSQVACMNVYIRECYLNAMSIDYEDL